MEAASSKNVSEILQHAFALHRAGKLAEAGAAYERVLAELPQELEALHHLGLVRYQQGAGDEGLRLIQAAIAQGLRAPRVYQNLAAVLESLGRLPEALQARRDAADAAAATGEPAPTAQEYLARAEAAEQRGDLAEATQQRRQALALNAGDGAGWLQLARVLAARERPLETLAALDQAVLAQPGSALAWSARADVLEELQRIPEAVLSVRRALALNPHQPVLHSRLLWLLNYEDPPHPLAMREEAETWARVQTAGIVPQANHPNSRDPDRPLRLGLVCADFRAHPAVSFLGLWYEHHDRDDISLTSYCDVATPDLFTDRFRQRSDRWRDVRGLSDEAIAARIREDGIDILMDRTGHMLDHRLLVFARKPAPVQVAYMGYANTRGLAAIDWWLTDPLVNPPESQSHFTERLANLPGCFLSYAVPLAYPDVAPPPSSRGEPFTFGSFNNAAKLTPRTVRLWSRVLNALPHSRLLLRSKTLERRATQQHLASQFAAHGVAPERVLFDAYIQKQAYLAEYARVDLALDPMPNNGVTTTLDALWMGVPVVTLTGDTAVSRYCSSILTHLGRPEWVASTEDQFVALALHLAGDPARLAALRTTQRAQMAGSPLCDGPGFTRGLEQTLRRMWVAWCRT